MKLLAENKKAYKNYEILERYEAGIVLLGSEVKSIKNRAFSFKDSFILIEKGEAWLYNFHISPYANAYIPKYDPERKRKLLLNKKEIIKLATKVQEKGLTIVPLKVYIKNGLIKLEIALVRGLRKYDKRKAIKEKELKRQIDYYKYAY